MNIQMFLSMMKQGVLWFLANFESFKNEKSPQQIKIDIIFRLSIRISLYNVIISLLETENFVITL